MQLNENSRLVKWAYFHRKKSRLVYDTPDNTYGRFTNIPAATTLCRFFWRAFFFVPLFWLVIATATIALLAFAYIQIIEIGVLTFLQVLVAVIAGIAAVVGTVAAFQTDWSQMKRHTLRENTRHIKERVSDSTFVQGVKAIKSKFCPIITFVNEAR